MTAEERQHRLSVYLQEVEFASLEELAQQVDASLSTVRRDLTLMEVSGGIRRIHGGARLVNPRSDELAFTTRSTHESGEKEAIGQACADLIRPNQSLILDAGTTVYHVARRLESKNLQIITNSLPVANLFSSANQVEVVLSGGVIYPRLGVLVGPFAAETFAKIHADVAIMGAGGITSEGVTNSHGLLIDIQRNMIQAAQRVIFCLDHTKVGRRSFLPLCGLDAVDVVVTDGRASSVVLDSLRAQGIEVVVGDGLEPSKA
jgi:DeoR/GlpR family transcriptional regulator of sugar metabolism